MKKCGGNKTTSKPKSSSPKKCGGNKKGGCKK